MAYRRYAGFVSATNTASTTVPMFQLGGATTTRLRLFDFISGSNATPADNYAQLAFRRSSALGTSSASFTPTALDPADPASLASFSTAWSTAPTITASSDLLEISHNQRATFRWVAAPDSELVVAASTTGLCLMSVATSGAVSFTFNALWQE